MERDIFTMPLDLRHELAIDNFAGGGDAAAANFAHERQIARAT